MIQAQIFDPNNPMVREIADETWQQFVSHVGAAASLAVFMLCVEFLITRILDQDDVPLPEVNIAGVKMIIGEFNDRITKEIEQAELKVLRVSRTETKH